MEEKAEHSDDLKQFCSDAMERLQQLHEALAQLGPKFTETSEAYRDLQRQVLAMDEFLQRSAHQPPPEDTPLWMNALEEAFDTTQQLEDEVLEAVARLVTRLTQWRERSAAAKAAAIGLRSVAVARVNMHHNSLHPPLLRLPDGALDIIARNMGKRARLLCSQLRAAYGPPGAVLKIERYPAPALPNGLGITRRDPIRCWPYPEAVRQLSMGYAAPVNGPCCQVIAEALPHLRELSAFDFNPLTASASPTSPLTALTSLRAQHATAGFRMRSVPALAPHLRSLTIESIQGIRATAFGDAMWGALASLRGLERLHVPTLSSHLTTAAFPSAMQHLTALTHLGLELGDNRYEARPSSEVLRGFTRALVGLPLLASIALDDFAPLGESLGPALQAVRLLSALEMGQQDDMEEDEDDEAEGLPDIGGCLPSISAMPQLRRLRLSGDAIMGSEEFWQLGSGGSASVNFVEVYAGDTEHTPAVCSMLSQLSGLTRLDVILHGDYAGEHMWQAAHNGILTHTLSQHTRLQRLRIRADLRGFVPWLARLPELTCLDLNFVRGGVLEADLRVVRALSSLVKLQLGDIPEAGCRVLCMEAVRQLPLLEDVHLGFTGSQWSEEEVRMLLPPPARLKSLEVVVADALAVVHWGLDVMKQYACYNVDMVCS